MQTAGKSPPQSLSLNCLEGGGGKALQGIREKATCPTWQWRGVAGEDDAPSQGQERERRQKKPGQTGMPSMRKTLQEAGKDIAQRGGGGGEAWEAENTHPPSYSSISLGRREDMCTGRKRQAEKRHTTTCFEGEAACLLTLKSHGLFPLLAFLETWPAPFVRGRREKAALPWWKAWWPGQAGGRRLQARNYVGWQEGRKEEEGAWCPIWRGEREKEEREAERQGDTPQLPAASPALPVRGGTRHGLCRS